VLVTGVTGGLTPYHFQVDSFRYGLPPFNMSIDLATGNLAGTPTRTGTYKFNVCAVDIGGAQDCRQVVMQVIKGPANIRIFIGGDVATLTEITLDGTLIKGTDSQNLAFWTSLTLGSHDLSFTCTEVYCFAYMQIEVDDPRAPAGVTVSPASIDLPPDVLTPGATKSFTLTINPP
jgi:hypothetical protein